MNRILIADDEIWVHRALAEQIAWRELDAVPVGDAYNGEQALEMALELEPDILITDVKMPFIGGLELIEQLEAKLPLCRVVVISGYSEFELVKKAMLHRAVSYVLKPIDGEELNASLRQAIALLETQRRQADNQSIAKEKYLSDLLANPALDDRLLHETLAALQIPLKGEQYQVVDIDIEGYEELLARFDGAPQSLDKWLEGHVHREFGDEGAVCFRDIRDNRRYLALCAYAAGETRLNMLHTVMGRVQRLAQAFEAEQVRFLIGVGLPHTGAQGLLASQHEAAYCRQFLLENRSEPYAFYENLQKKKSDYTLARIVDYIQRHYAQPLTLEAVARIFFLSPSYLSRYFKSHLGETFVGYLTRVRMQQAERLMQTTQLKVHEVARMVGYENINYFGKLFKRHTGKAPSEYAEAGRGKG